jgi:hypothetical protein
MSLPGFNTNITIQRVSQTGHEDDGTPIVALSLVWKGKAHYQPETRDSIVQLDTATGSAAEAKYLFFVPYLTGVNRPVLTDVIDADELQYVIEEISREGLRHHLILMAKRVDR